jgi:hypothetical protein
VNRIVSALVLFALAAFGAGKLRDGYQDGRMPTLFARFNLLAFDRVQAPAFFWGATVINLVIVTGFMLGGILLMAVGFGL